MAIVGDTMLIVRDIPEFRIEAFDLRTGEAMPGWVLDIQVFTGIAHLADQVIVGALSTERGSSLLLFSLGDSTATPTFVGSLPEEVHGNPMVADAFRHTAVTGRDSTIAQAFEVSNYLHWVSLGSEMRDSIELPVARRKGAPVHLLPQLEAKPELGMRAVSHVSQPLKIGWLNDSLLAVVMVDPDRSTSQYRGTTWVSVVDLRNRRSCVDAHVDISTDPPPSVALRADTLYFLYFAEAASGRTETRVRRAVLDLGTCTWVGDARPASGAARQRAVSTP